MFNAVDNSVYAVQQELTAQYGPFLRHRHVAEVLDVSPESLRNTLRRSRQANVVYLGLNKLRFGRRIRYTAKCVAEALVLDGHELERRMKESDAGGSDND